MPTRFTIAPPSNNGSVSDKRLVRYSPQLDTFRRYITDTPSPEKFANYLKDAERGDLAALCEMQQEMEAKDLWLRGICETRRGALNLEWDIEPNLEGGNESAAKAAADYCRAQLRKVKTWPDTLEHFGSAYGPNIAISELVWFQAELAETVDVPGHRLRLRPWVDQEPWVQTDEAILGIPVRSEEYGIAPKFAVFNTHKAAGFPFRSTLTHATVWPWLCLRFSRVDWMAFSELYGTPIRIAKYDPTVVDADRTTVDDMLKELGSDTEATLPDGINIELLQANGEGETFERQMQWAQKTLSVGWLGQTLSTDVGDTGSFAAAKVHDNVRTDLLMSDIQREKRLIENQILEPMVRMKFPGADMPIPFWVRKINETKNTEVSRLRKDQLFAARALGLDVSKDEAYDILEISRPESASDLLDKPKPVIPDDGDAPPEAPDAE